MNKKVNNLKRYLKSSRTKLHKCPICNKFYNSYPAISRKDNKTKICSNCGLQEAFNDYLLYMINNSK